MSDFLSQLIRRHWQPEAAVKPRPLSRFEPVPGEAGLGGLDEPGGVDIVGLEAGAERVEAAPEQSPAGRTEPMRPGQSLRRDLQAAPPAPPHAGSQPPKDAVLRPAPALADDTGGSPAAARLPVMPRPPEAWAPRPPGEKPLDLRPAPVFVPGEAEDAAARAELAALAARLEKLSAGAREAPAAPSPPAPQPVQARPEPLQPAPASRQPPARLEAARPAPLQPVAVRALPFPVSQAAPEPPAPTIQVSIGRIEVRASAPPATPARKPAGGPALTLEDYLRQRNREQP